MARPASLALSTLAVLAMCLFTAWFFEMPLERALLVAPIIVLSFGAAAFLVVLWAKVIVEGVRERRRPQ